MKAKIFLSIVSMILVAVAAPANVAQNRADSESAKAQPTKPAPASLLVSTLEQATIDEINLARADPSAYARYLVEFKQYFHGREIHYPDGFVLVSNEGVAPLDEAIAFMRSLKPAPPLQLSPGMVSAAKDHLNDLVKTGRSGHKGSDGSTVSDRLNRYGTWAESLGEDIVYHSRSAREDVVALIIDDGTSTRGHRKNIFKSDFQVVGIAQSPQLKTGTISVITFSAGFTDKPAIDPKTKTPTATKF
ncbi:MAG TPA: CAP domain-containing protein [Pyrinomonadaceae bacterium]|jgi:uncharacterized protein YkwD|nr:CAP domain-containing protein [Pyrinomonadaceae bacterium]